MYIFIVKLMFILTLELNITERGTLPSYEDAFTHRDKTIKI